MEDTAGKGNARIAETGSRLTLRRPHVRHTVDSGVVAYPSTRILSMRLAHIRLALPVLLTLAALLSGLAIACEQALMGGGQRKVAP